MSFNASDVTIQIEGVDCDELLGLTKRSLTRRADTTTTLLVAVELPLTDLAEDPDDAFVAVAIVEESVNTVMEEFENTTGLSITSITVVVLEVETGTSSTDDDDVDVAVIVGSVVGAVVFVAIVVGVVVVILAIV